MSSACTKESLSKVTIWIQGMPRIGMVRLQMICVLHACWIPGRNARVPNVKNLSFIMIGLHHLVLSQPAAS
jgi:hypothetical protein